jgi:hypothetical protein
MALDDRYFIAVPLNQYFVDKDTGLPLANGTITFYRDVSRTTPKAVFQLTGTPPNYQYTALPNPITLSSAGTIQNATNDNVIFYFFPYDENGNVDLYYIECKNSGGTLQWTREGIPNLTATNNPTNDPFPLVNQIANPQFSRVFINETVSMTYSATAATDQVFSLAPDWDFVISGTGTVDVQQVAIAGNENVVTSPPYVLDVTVSNGITSCLLRQRFAANSGLWASTANQQIFLAGTFIARNENSGSTGLDLFYVDSTGSSPITIVSATFDNSGYTVQTGATASAIPLSTDTNTGEDGFIDIYFSFSPSSHIRISSVQVVPTLSDAGADLIQYDTQSSNREQALMGDYFIPNLEAKRIPSLLTGWDFPVNPAQFGATGNITTTAAYIWDQTIGDAATSNVAYARSAVTGGLQLTTTGTNDAFFIMQYLDPIQGKDWVTSALSVKVEAFKGSAGDDVTMQVYLVRGSSAAAYPTLPTTIGTVATDGTFTVSAANWELITRSGLDTAQATLNSVATNDQLANDNTYSFSGWQMTDATDLGDTNKLAIIITFAYPDASTVITVDSVGLCLGNIPSLPAPQTPLEALRSCQFFYESNYPLTVAPGTATASGIARFQLQNIAGTGVLTAYAQAFTLEFQGKKRTTPTISFYALDGTINEVTIVTYTSANTVSMTNEVLVSSNWAVTPRADGFTALPSGTGEIITDAGAATFQSYALIYFNFVADARLGI